MAITQQSQHILTGMANNNRSVRCLCFICTSACQCMLDLPDVSQCLARGTRQSCSYSRRYLNDGTLLRRKGTHIYMDHPPPPLTPPHLVLLPVSAPLAGHKCIQLEGVCGGRHVMEGSIQSAQKQLSCGEHFVGWRVLTCHR